MFFVMFVSFSFLYISSKIKLSISKTKDFYLDDYFYNFKNNDLNRIKDETKYINLQNISSYSGSFINWKDKVFSFKNSNTGSLNILYWWPILYYISNTNSWIIYNLQNFNFSSWNKIILTNLGWYTNFEFDFTTSSWIIFPDNYYTIIKNIWWQNILSETIRQ